MSVPGAGCRRYTPSVPHARVLHMPAPAHQTGAQKELNSNRAALTAWLPV